MAKQVADVDIHAADAEHDDLDDIVSVDLIDDGLYLGNLACARDYKTLKELKITHILTIDIVPLPRTILDRPNLTFKFIKLSDMVKEDLITPLPEAISYIKESIQNGGTVFTHCYYGVSRSAAIVIGYIMDKYGLCYEEAYTLVQSKRRLVHPNIGFVAQLKLFGHMGCKINKDDPRYKQFRLKMAGRKLKQVKILPQQFADLIKPDPGLTKERPDPIVYRCKKCRRIVASQSNIIPHLPKEVKIHLAKKGIRPPPNKLTGLNIAENGQILIQKLKSLAGQMMETSLGEGDTESSVTSPEDNRDTRDFQEGTSHEIVDGYSEDVMVDWSVAGGAGGAGACRLVWFVEPMAWMRGVAARADGKLHCPACQQKIGSYNWLMGCRCPCGQKVAPAFYLVPSKVEWSNIVQNVQITV